MINLLPTAGGLQSGRHTVRVLHSMFPIQFRLEFTKCGRPRSPTRLELRSISPNGRQSITQPNGKRTVHKNNQQQNGTDVPNEGLSDSVSHIFDHVNVLSFQIVLFLSAFRAHSVDVNTSVRGHCRRIIARMFLFGTTITIELMNIIFGFFLFCFSGPR